MLFSSCAAYVVFFAFPPGAALAVLRGFCVPPYDAAAADEAGMFLAAIFADFFFCRQFPPLPADVYAFWSPIFHFNDAPCAPGAATEFPGFASRASAARERRCCARRARPASTILFMPLMLHFVCAPMMRDTIAARHGRLPAENGFAMHFDDALNAHAFSLPAAPALSRSPSF